MWSNFNFILSAVIIILQIFDISAVQYEADIFELVQELRSTLKGYVFIRGSPDYETARAVHNGACRNIFPLMVVKPLETEDVAKAVRFATKYHIETSVRSGGHSYQCLGTKVS